MLNRVGIVCTDCGHKWTQFICLTWTKSGRLERMETEGNCLHCRDGMGGVRVAQMGNEDSGILIIFGEQELK